ncbi:hypothetical protein FDENT_8316 [Fusarium denticulatum]|uniref:Xylanolytic transcriptional activator regulatory domain-containing protein n=1 Tax=Fusarium denticulatum TaxID=48507 RepID=A0A8H5TYL9_9HYPO|nr:hypothetical protein FDENT_8316 [Fusarium denticulatum]
MNHAREMTPDEEPPQKRQRVLACRSGDQCMPTEPASRTLVESHYVRALQERVAELEKQNPEHNIDHLASNPAPLNGQPLPDEARMATASANASRGSGSGRTEQRPSTIIEDISMSPANQSQSHSHFIPGRSYSNPSPSATAAISIDDASDTGLDQLIYGLIASPSTCDDGRHSALVVTPLNASAASNSDFLPQTLITTMSAELQQVLITAYKDRAQTQYPIFHWNHFLEWFSDWKACASPELPSRYWQGFFVNLVCSTALLLLSLPRVGQSDAKILYKQGMTLLPYLYANIDDDDIDMIAAQTAADQELPDSNKYTYENSLDWRLKVLNELESYKARVQNFTDPQSKGHTSQRWLAMIYLYTLLTLYRPTMDNVLGPAGDWSIQAGSQACLIFRKSQMDRQIAQAWLGLLVQFQSGVTILYCCWATPPEYRTESYYSPDVSNALRACSNILALLTDRWPKAECLRDVFELLAREVPLVDRPNRPPMRISDTSASTIKERLPLLRALISVSGEGEVGDTSTLEPDELFAFPGIPQLPRSPEVQDPPRLSQSTHTQDEKMYLVDLYFRFIHDSPHSLFHEPTFKASVAEGIVSQPVLLAMLGLSARFATDPDVVARGPMYRAQATAALKEDLEHICIENIQACILVGNNFFGEGDADAESLYFGLASRMTQILKLGEIDESDDGVIREVKRRIFWTCFIIDTWASGGSNLSPQFRWRTKQPRGPLDEYMFYNMRLGDGDVADVDWKPGLWAHMVRLVGLYAEIQNLQQELANGVEWNEPFIDESVQRLEAELGAFEEGLGPELMFSRENLASFVSRGLGRVFIAFHLGYHHYYTLLFYQYLDHRRPPTRNGRKYASSCKAHAAIVCDVLKASREVPGAEALYNIVGHVTIVSSSVLLHTYLFGESHELEESRDRLSSNLESLVQLRNYWPSVEMMIKRLVVFQKNCIQSMNAESYRFDRWMVKFLIAHALALEDKADDNWSAASVEATNGNDHLERGRITQAMIMDIQNYDTET